MRQQLERLLQADDARDEVADRGFVTLAHAIGDAPPDLGLPPGTRIGAFELLEQLGEGGSSTVYRARRSIEGVSQEVALKILHRSLLSPLARRQFDRERRALAQLQHPNIARLIDGGVSDGGIAYLALELIGRVRPDRARDRRAAAGRRAPAPVPGHLPRGAGRPSGADRASRPQALEHPRHRRRPRQAGRLRHRQVAARRDPRRHRQRAPRLHAGLFGARAARGRRHHHRDRCLCAGHRAGRAPDRAAPATRAADSRLRARCRAPSAPGALPAPVRSLRRRLRGDLDNIVLKAIATEARAALRVGGRAGGGHRARPRRPAGAGASALALVRAAQVRGAPSRQRAGHGVAAGGDRRRAGRGRLAGRRGAQRGRGRARRGGARECHARLHVRGLRRGRARRAAGRADDRARSGGACLFRGAVGSARRAARAAGAAAAPRRGPAPAGRTGWRAGAARRCLRGGTAQPGAR